MKNQYDSLNAESVDENDYDEMIESVKSINSKSEKKIPFIYLILSFVLIIIGLFVKVLAFKVALIILGVLLLGLFVVLLNKVKQYNKKLQEEKENYNAKYGGVKSEDAAILYINNLKDKSLSKKNSNNEINKLYMDFLQTHNINDLIKYSNFIIIGEYECVKDVDVQLRLLHDEIHEIDNNISKNEGILSTIDNASKLAELKAKIDDYNEILSNYKKQKEAYIIAKELINDSKEEVFNNFTPQLKKNLSLVLNELSGGKFKDIIIDSELNIKLDEGSNLFAIDYYSQGYKDLVYLALRIAIIKMATKEGLPIFLDDPFVNLDIINKKRVMDYFIKLANQNQIFYFSCTNID